MFNTFDQIAALYANTKPVAGKKKDLNIRPIGPRRRQWERIAKINDDCYVLSDGCFAGDPIFGTWVTRSKTIELTQKDFVDFAPIVWRRHEDGSETITIRNSGHTAHVSTVTARHAFLRDFLPMGIQIENKKGDGRHFISVGPGSYYLPKVTSVPEAYYDALNSGGYSVSKNLQKGADKNYLIFRRDGGNWCLMSKAFDAPIMRVNKAEKQKHKENVKAFREWCLLMLPMLKIDYHTIRAARTNMLQYCKDFPSTKTKSGMFSDYSFYGVRSIVDDSSNPLRVELLVIIASNGWNSDVEYFRKGFSRKLNKLCGWIE